MSVQKKYVWTKNVQGIREHSFCSFTKQGADVMGMKTDSDGCKNKVEKNW